MTDHLDTLLAVRDVPAPRGLARRVGITAHDLAEHQDRSVDDVLSDLDRLAADGLVSRESGPWGSVYYDVTTDGDDALRELRGIPTPPEALEFDLAAGDPPPDYE